MKIFSPFAHSANILRREQKCWLLNKNVNKKNIRMKMKNQILFPKVLYCPKVAKKQKKSFQSLKTEIKCFT